MSPAVQLHLQGRAIDSNVSSCGGVRQKGQGGVKQRYIRHSQGLNCFFSSKAGIELSFWKEIAENTLASWHKERRWERPKKERTFTMRKSLSQKEAKKREEMKWKARFGVRTEGRAKQKIDIAPTKNENICMVTKIEGIMPGSARIWTEMKQTKMQEKLFCSLLPSK